MDGQEKVRGSEKYYQRPEKTHQRDPRHHNPKGSAQDGAGHNDPNAPRLPLRQVNGPPEHRPFLRCSLVLAHLDSGRPTS